MNGLTNIMNGRFVLVFCCSTLLLFIHQISARCKPPRANQGSYYTPNRTSYDVGWKIIFRCRSSCTLVGSSSSTCEVYRGRYGWNPPRPTCICKCKRPRNPSYGRVVSENPHQTDYTIGEWVRYECNPGYCMQGDATVYCRKHGWTHSPSCVEGCKDRSPPSYGSYRGKSNGWCPGRKANFKCNLGFRIYGHPSSLCGKDGKWDHPVPSCKRVCGKAPDLEYGMVVPSSSKPSYEKGDYVTYRCKPGYCLYGNPRVQCGHKGFGDMPRCRRQCIHRNPPSYGSYHGHSGSNTKWCPGQRARYQCNPAFRMAGHEYSRCQDDGSWEYDVPMCRNRTQGRNTKNPRTPHLSFWPLFNPRINPSNMPAYPEETEANLHRCGPAPTLLHGRLVIPNPPKSSYAVGEWVIYRCDLPYCMQGTPLVCCRHHGWENTPTCRKPCVHRHPPSYGSYAGGSGSNTKWCPGQRARFRCNRGYRMYGHEYSTCQNNGTWDFDVPMC